MDKQLIERMKAEVRAEMRSTFSPSVESFIDAYTDRLLARIDAERGKEAVAIVDFRTNGWRTLIDALKSIPDGTPLFISQAIPKSTALVSVELLDSQREILALAFAHGNCVLFSDLWRDLLAAAQGERNAD